MKIKFKPLALSVVISILTMICVYSQLEIDAGRDTTFCVGLWGLDTTIIGGNPAATGGIEPYTYKWSCDVWVGGTLHFTASDFLNNISLPNPKFKDNCC